MAAHGSLDADASLLATAQTEVSCVDEHEPTSFQVPTLWFRWILLNVDVFIVQPGSLGLLLEKTA